MRLTTSLSLVYSVFADYASTILQRKINEFSQTIGLRFNRLGQQNGAERGHPPRSAPYNLSRYNTRCIKLAAIASADSSLVR
jgi:hypothetical protein